jgi:hypothetical protein
MQRPQRHEDRKEEKTTLLISLLCGLCVLCDLCAAPKYAIARFVRQTRTITYEKSENFRAGFLGNAAVSASALRQTRTRSVSCRGGSLASE